MRRAAIRSAVRAMLDGLPLATPGVADDLPAVVVSTPEDGPAENGGYVDGSAEIDVTLTVAAYGATEDEVDDLLARVEQRIAGDRSLGGTATDLTYEGYALEADETAYEGVATWTARVPTRGV